MTAEDVISWGGNSMGQCGHGDRAEADWVKPRSLKPLQGLFVSQIVCGRHHTLCVTATSQVHTPLCRSAHFARRILPACGTGVLGLKTCQDVLCLGNRCIILWWASHSITLSWPSNFSSH